MGRLAHSIAFLCFVLAARCIRVEAYRKAAIHSSDLDRIEQKDASNLQFIPHPPWVGTVVGVYNLARSITDIVKHLEDFNAVANSKMVGDMMYDLESLYAIHDLIAKKLSLTHKHYDCDNCTDAQIDDNYAFKRTTFAGVNFETANNLIDAGCVHELKDLIMVLRHTLTKLELGSYEMVRNLEQKSLSDGAQDAEELASLFEVDMGCDGAEFDPSRLETFHEAPLLLEAEMGRKRGHCRELPDLSASDAQAACMQKCLAEANCAGFTWLDGRDDDSIDGSRCCFRSDISHRYAQKETSCFVASRARLLHLDTAGVTMWLTDHGFQAASQEKLRLGLEFNGLVLAALTKSKIQQYLGPMSNAQAAEIKCAIDVDIVGVGHHRCVGEDVVARYQAGVGVVDPYVFFGVKSGNGAFLSKDWAIGAASRLLPDLLKYSKKFFFEAKKEPSQYVEAIQTVKGLLDTYLGWAFAYNAGNTFVDMTFLSTAFNPLVYANAVTLLTKTGMEARWDQCSFVYGLLMEQNVWEQVNVYVHDK